MERKATEYQVFADGGYYPATKSGQTASLILQDNLVLAKLRDRGTYQSSLDAELAAPTFALEELPKNSSAIIFTDCATILHLISIARNEPAFYQWIKNRKTIISPSLVSRFLGQANQHDLTAFLVPRKHPLIYWCDLVARHSGDFLWQQIAIDKPLDWSRRTLGNVAPMPLQRPAQMYHDEAFREVRD